MTKISAYVAAWKLNKMVADRKAEAQKLAQLRAELRGPDRIADYGDNGTEAQFYILTENFR